MGWLVIVAAAAGVSVVIFDRFFSGKDYRDDYSIARKTGRVPKLRWDHNARGESRN